MGEPIIGLEKFIPKTCRTFAVGVGIALAILLCTVVCGLFIMRGLVRDQILQHDGEALYATTLMEQLDCAEPDELDLRTEEQLSFDAAVRSSRLRGVMGIRFFNAEGAFSDSFPASVMPQPLDAAALKSIQAFEPRSAFAPLMPMDDIFIYLPRFAESGISRVPVVLVTIPLHGRDTKTLNGAAQFIIEGHSMAEEFRLLDLHLFQMGLVTFGIAGSILLAMLWPVFYRTQQLTRELELRNDRLQRANDELALTARVSAIGAVSAHLMHGLRNPLASLSEFIAGQNDTGAVDDEDLKDALSASRRMKQLVEYTLQVLSDARSGPAYELTVPELCRDAVGRVQAAAGRNGVELLLSAEGSWTLSSRTANLLGLILVNLLENAVAATPSGGAVSLRVSRLEDRLCFRAADEGPGVPAELQEQLFHPCRPGREGGSGLGLAISKQIADYLKARLLLEETSAAGSVFCLELPIAVCQESVL